MKNLILILSALLIFSCKKTDKTMAVTGHRFSIMFVNKSSDVPFFEVQTSLDGISFQTVFKVPYSKDSNGLYRIADIKYSGELLARIKASNGAGTTKLSLVRKFNKKL